MLLDTDDEIEESITNEQHNSPSPRPKTIGKMPRSATVEADREISEVKREPKPWWHDRNTVFKEWARAHERLARRKKLESVTLPTDQKGSVMPILKRDIDIEKWRM